MDAPPIQYARTSDGVSIAYGSVGDGQAIVYMQGIPTRHFSLLWKLSADDRLLAQLAAARGRRWVVFDPRGMGSSAPVDSFSLEGFVADLEAVADTLDLRQFDLIAATYSNPIAVEYAVRHPDRVSHLVLHYPFLRSGEALDTPAMAAVRALREQDWSIFTDASMHILFGNQSGTEMAQIFAQVQRAAITPDRGRKVLQLVDGFDMTEQAARVEVPTLVLTEPDLFIAELYSRAGAAAIPSAQFILAETRERFANETWRFLDAAPGAAMVRAADGAPDTAALTRREREVLVLLVAGQSNRKIAESLVLSERTVARHIANIYKKTGAHGRAEITAYALRHRLV